MTFWQINPQKIQTGPRCPRSSGERWLVYTAWMIKSPRKCALRINSLQRSRSLTRCSLRFHPAANRSVPTERKIEGAINSCKVIYLKDSPKRRLWVPHKRSIVRRGTLCRDHWIVPGGDKEAERRDEFGAHCPSGLRGILGFRQNVWTFALFRSQSLITKN